MAPLSEERATRVFPRIPQRDATEALISYVTHANAPLTPAGRLELVLLVVRDGWAQARAAERLQVSRATVSK